MNHKRTILIAVATVAFLLTIGGARTAQTAQTVQTLSESLATTSSRLRMSRGILRLPDKTSFTGGRYLSLLKPSGGKLDTSNTRTARSDFGSLNLNFSAC